MKPSWMRAIDEAAAKYGVTKDQILGTSRSYSIIPARQEAYYIAVERSHLPLHAVARFFVRSHTTLLSGISRHCERNNIPMPKGYQFRPKARQSSPLAEAIRKAAAEGAQRSAIARRLGCSRAHVTQTLGAMHQ